jgi:hypothetical protein
MFADTLDYAIMPCRDFFFFFFFFIISADCWLAAAARRFSDAAPLRFIFASRR